MILEGTIVFAQRPSAASMNAWKRVKENIPSVICPCKLAINTQLIVLESFSNGVLMCRIGNSTAATIILDRDVRILA
jgi:hypothetical protein